MTNIAIFASGSGSNFESIMSQVVAGKLPQIEVTALYTDRVDAYCIERARKYNLEGYMKLIGANILNAYPKRIINIHPSLLPKYRGKDAVGQALNSGESITGTTVHYVDSGMDTGEIIEQRICDIKPGDTKEQLETRIKALEHTLYPEVISKIIQ